MHFVASSIIYPINNLSPGDLQALYAVRLASLRFAMKNVVCNGKNSDAPPFFEADIQRPLSRCRERQGRTANLRMGKVKKKGAKGPLRKQKGWEAAAGDQAELERHQQPDKGAQPLQLFSKKVREEASEPQQQGMEAQEHAAPAGDAPLILFSRKLRASSASDPQGVEQCEAPGDSTALGVETGAAANPVQLLSSQKGSSLSGSAAGQPENGDREQGLERRVENRGRGRSDLAEPRDGIADKERGNERH